MPNIQPTSATVRLDSDGTLAVVTGSVDIAGTNMGLALIAAEAYGVDIEQVRIVTGDTDTVAADRPQRRQQDDLHRRRGGGRGGRGRAPADARDRRRELEVSVEDLDLVGDSVVVQRRAGSVDQAGGHRQEEQHVRLDSSRRCSGSASARLRRAGAGLRGRSLRGSRSTRHGPGHAARLRGRPGCRQAINPLGIEGQMQGGAVQSLGFALTEGLLYDEQGRLTNPSLLDYRKLTAADLPNIETIIVEVPAPAGPFGARGVGEPPIVPAPAAIANAIEDATGRAPDELPLTPERVALGIAEHQRNGSSNGRTNGVHLRRARSKMSR